MPRSILATAITCAIVLASTAHAADPDWHVVLANSNASVVVLPNLLPDTGSFELDSVALSDGTTGVLGFGRSHGSQNYGLWSERNGTLLPFAENMATGALGPGRTGADAGHVFRTLWQRHDGSASSNRVFAARAGEPTQPADAATYGIWIWNGTRNTEIARLNTAGALGPGFGGGIDFTSFGNTSSTHARVHALPDGGALFDAVVTGSNKAVVVHEPGVGNRGCLLEGSTDPAWSPGVAANAYFYHGGTVTTLIDVPIVSARGDVLISASYRITGSSTNLRGVFRLCRGAPQALALAFETGATGPGLVDAGATFSEFGRVRPGTADEAFFWARGSGADGAFTGGFHHADGVNRPLWLNNTEGPYGPGYPSYYFNETSAPILQASGRYAVLNTTIRPTAGTTSVRGLWRMAPGQPPQPVAIVGDTGAYAPAPGRAWRAFHLTTILDNGQILTLAEISNPTASGLWRLSPGEAPVQLLGAGDTVQVPTASGLVPHAVTTFATSYFSDQYPGPDGWVSSNGDAVVRLNLQGINSQAQVFVRGRPARSEAVFQHGFD